MKQLSKLQVKTVSVSGNVNRMYRPFTLQKLSGFMDSQQMQKLFLQSGENQGKFMLKKKKHQKVVLDFKLKSKKRQDQFNHIKTQMVEV